MTANYRPRNPCKRRGPRVYARDGRNPAEVNLESWTLTSSSTAGGAEQIAHAIYVARRRQDRDRDHALPHPE